MPAECFRGKTSITLNVPWYVLKTPLTGAGTIMVPEEMEKVYDTAHELGLKVHLDGARIFNAAVLWP